MTNSIQSKSTTRKYQVIRPNGGGVAGVMRAEQAIAYVQANGGAIYSREQYKNRGGTTTLRVDSKIKTGEVVIVDYFKGRGYLTVTNG